MFVKINSFRARKTRGTVLLEFALIMPFVFIFIAMMVDVARIYLVRNAAQDAAFASARAGAQVGYWGALDVTEGPSKQAAQEAFNASLVARQGWADIGNVTSDPCSPANGFDFTTTVPYSINPILPSLAGLPSTLNLQTVGVSRCEIVR